MKNLHTIRFVNVKVTGVGVKALVKEQSKLRWLVLENCTGISPDAITWAETQHVKVLRKIELMPGGASLGGRTVRYDQRV